MKVDMSSEAITARLQTVDELWLLSVKLMNAKPTDGEPLAQRRSQALEIIDAIRQVLFKDWDPIGINDSASNVDEYDAYIAPVYRILVGSRSVDDLIGVMRSIEEEQIGVRTSSLEKLNKVTSKLLGLNVVLD